MLVLDRGRRETASMASADTEISASVVVVVKDVAAVVDVVDVAAFVGVGGSGNGDIGLRPEL